MTVHAFEPPPPRAPRAPLLRTADGSFFGTLSVGGAGGHGALFQFFPARRTIRLLHVFAGNDGSGPRSPLVEGPGGMLYGTTGGGPGGRRTLFRFAVLSRTLTTLYDFSADGLRPGGVVFASDGRLYGVVGSDTTFGVTTIYRYDPASGAVTFLQTLATGGPPFPPLTEASDGYLYGVGGCGQGSGGALFRFDPAAASGAVLRTFAQATGFSPCAAVHQAADGALYGATERGGASDRGVLYRFDPATAAYTVLHQFGGATGARPRASLLQGTDGALYGTTPEGGANGRGTLYRYDTASGLLGVVRQFGGATGFVPESALVDAGDGTLLGTTSGSGDPAIAPDGAGTIYRYDPAAGTFGTEHRFGNARGSTPQADLAVGPDGALFGTTTIGGAGGEGTVFRFDSATGTLSTVHAFDGASGAQPVAGVVIGADGALYGTALAGGTLGMGTVFRADPGTGATTAVHEFTGSFPDNGAPRGRLLLRADGSMWGTTAGNAFFGSGSVFRYDPATASLQTMTGIDPSLAGLAEAGGMLYGTSSPDLGGSSSQTLFALDPATLTVTDLVTLGPVWRMLTAATEAGGDLYLPIARWSTGAVVYRRNLATGQFSFPVTFSGPDGDSPLGALVAGPDGALYGTTELGGDFGLGTVYRFKPGATGHTVIHHFRGTDGAHPRAGVVFGTDGALYGTTADGGPLGGGTIYRLRRWR